MFDITINSYGHTYHDVCDGYAGLISYIDKLRNSNSDGGITVIIARSNVGRLKALLRLECDKIAIDCLDGVSGFENELKALGFTVTRH